MMSAIIKKELLQLRRDPRLVALIVVMPLVLLILFGIALKLEPQNVRMAYFDGLGLDMHPIEWGPPDSQRPMLPILRGVRRRVAPRCPSGIVIGVWGTPVSKRQSNKGSGGSKPFGGALREAADIEVGL